MPNKDVLTTFLNLLNFNSPSRSEHDVSLYCAERLRTIGFDVKWDASDSATGSGVGNLIATLPPTDSSLPALLFAAHLDTVEPTPNITVEITGDVITASSDTILGGDDKCGAAPIISAMEEIVENNIPHGQLQVVFTTCEEIGLVGAANIDQSMLSSDYGFVLDGGPPLGSIVTSAPASECLEIAVNGKAAHAGAAPEKGINAIVAAARAIASFPVGRIDSETTNNVGVITGGQARNVVPDTVTIIAEARSRNQVKLEEQLSIIRSAFELEASKMGATVSIRTTNSYPAYHLANDFPVISIAAQAASNIGYPPQFRESGGGTDANHFNGFGIPTAVLATGMEQIHTHDEFCTVSALHGNVRWIIEIVETAR
jgi:tripeptide aminopeptidase